MLLPGAQMGAHFRTLKVTICAISVLPVSVPSDVNSLVNKQTVGLDNMTPYSAAVPTKELSVSQLYLDKQHQPS